ncbi:HPr-rel-A system PqqD family peptide chaperone [Thioalkalivibrio sp. ALJT]|uniref:HPr-rel-A system PqqD family peptide chaperone n=1 Tax=Thioalkalivibrio sp. ALJT TaxID=1158146 RepID=UPI0018C91A3A
MSDNALQIVQGVHLRQCGEQWAAFHVGTGDTHLLDAVAGEILHCLRERGPLRRSDLSDCLEWDDAGGGPLAEWVAALLNHRLIREHVECLRGNAD